jgi:hypothetical protein
MVDYVGIIPLILRMVLRTGVECGFNFRRTLNALSVGKTNRALLNATHQEVPREWEYGAEKGSDRQSYL